MRRFLRNNSLSLVMFGLFFTFLVGLFFTGHNDYNKQLKLHKQRQLSYVEYLGSGNFLEAVFENWESEFLQMGSLVVLTVFLRQKGSPGSKKLEGEEAVDAEPTNSQFTKSNSNVPWPVRRGGLALKLYENSLSIVMFLLFFMSFALHGITGAWDYNKQQVMQGGKPVSIIAYFGTTHFWFQSFQNWQSEFLSVGSLITLSIFLRQKGSPESKPVDAPNDKTGQG